MSVTALKKGKSNKSISTQWEEAMDAYVKHFNSKPGIMHMMTEDAIELMNEAVATNTPLEEDLPKGTYEL